MSTEVVSNPPTLADLARLAANLQAIEEFVNEANPSVDPLPGGGTAPNMAWLAAHAAQIYATHAAAVAALPGLTNGTFVEVNADETQAALLDGSAPRYRYQVVAGALANAVNLDYAVSVLQQGALQDLASPRKPQTWQVANWTYSAVGATPLGLQLIGTATATALAAGTLSVLAPFTSGARVILPLTFGEGRIRFEFNQGKMMAAWRGKPDGSGFRIWSSNGTTLEVGYVDSVGTVTSLGSLTMPGGAGTAVTAEIECGPIKVAGGTYAGTFGCNLRCWVTANGYASYVGVAVGVPGALAVQYNSGVVFLQTLDNVTAAVFTSVSVSGDNLNAVTASMQCAFSGRWFTRYEGSRLCACTVRGGASFRFRSWGTAKITGSFVSSPAQTLAPVVAVYVGGVFQQFVTIGTDGANGGGSAGTLFNVDLITNLNPNVVSYVEVKVAGVHEWDDKYLSGAGLLLQKLYAYNGTVQPWDDKRPGFLFIGDSITEGILAHGSPSQPNHSGGDATYGVLTANYFGLKPVNNAFGGTGMTVSGSGGMPDAPINSTYFMQDRPIDPVADDISFILINHGTNDAGHGVANATFQAAYIAFLADCISRYKPKMIFCLRPFNGSYAAQIQAAATAMGNSAVAYIDTTGWLSGADFTDGTHPTAAGHVKAAGLLETALSPFMTSGQELF